VKTQLGPRCRWEDDLKMVLGEIGWNCGLDSPSSGWRPIAGSCEHSSEPSGSIKNGSFLE